MSTTGSSVARTPVLSTFLLLQPLGEPSNGDSDPGGLRGGGPGPWAALETGEAVKSN